MKMKRAFCWLLVFALCFVLAACQKTGVPTPDGTESTVEESIEQTEEKQTPTQDLPEPTEEKTPPSDAEPATPLLYRITDGNDHTVWLFGSIHVGRESYYPLPDYVLEAFDSADSLAVEVDIIAFEKDLKLQVEALAPLLYADGTTIKDHISQELYDDAVETLKGLNTYMKALDMYCPALWSSTIDSLLMERLGADIRLGVDRHLLERARAAGKEILEVENALSQYQMLAGFSDELQALLLEASVALYNAPEAAREDLTEMMELWASGDEQAFAAYLAGSDENMTPEEALLYEEYNQAMLADRNLFMADYAEAALLSGKEIFICVGAAHVIGEGAMTQLLSERGYIVERAAP